MNPSLKFISFLCIIIYSSSCVSLTGLEDGKGIGKERMELMGNISANRTPNLSDDFDIDTLSGTEIPTFFYPNLEIGVRYGITDKLDVRGRLNLTTNTSIGVKYQLVGDRESKIALAAGCDFGNMGFGLGLWNVQIPVYASYHPSEIFSLYLSPRYTYQFTSSFESLSTSVRYLGANAGFLIGSRNKFGIDIGYYNFNVDKYSSNFLISP